MSKGLESLQEMRKYGALMISNCEIIEKELKALEIIRKYYIVQESFDELFPYELHDKQYCGTASSLVINKQEFELLKEVL